jgi:predicted GNAT superfamily acetyltransferase
MTTGRTSISIERLTSCEALAACERLQREMSDHEEREVLSVPLLVSLGRSGGLVLGAYTNEFERPHLWGCLVDLVARYEGNPGRLTLVHGVAREARNRGIGYQLRARERKECREEGVRVVTWAIDPLRSVEAHIAFNKLGAIAVAYERNLYGERTDRMSPGLATDRLAVEWWIDSPRVAAVLDRRELPHHFHLGLDRMEVVTRTGLTERSGARRLLGFTSAPRGEIVLVEIPADLDSLRRLDPDLACDWRLKTRECFERLLACGYIVSGFLHEAGRSFHLLERAGREVFQKRAS